MRFAEDHVVIEFPREREFIPIVHKLTIPSRAMLAIRETSAIRVRLQVSSKRNFTPFTETRYYT